MFSQDKGAQYDAFSIPQISSRPPAFNSRLSMETDLSLLKMICKQS